jgi:methyl-accepting chemotaxis protein
VKGHKTFVDECKVSGSEPNVVCITPIKISENKQWTLCVLIPKISVLGDAKNITLTTFLLVFFCFLLLGIITILLANKISKSLRTIEAALIDVSDGDIKNNNDLSDSSLTEINNINQSMRSVISGLIKAAEFSEQIGSGKLDTEFSALSANDKLGNALINMRDNLKKADEEAKERKIADEKVNWATLGLAKFGEILHTNIQNINDLSYEILRNLIKYIDVNQGAIYVLDDTKEEPEYEMTTAIAYDRRKFMQKRFAVGEDLVGRCAYEHKTIYMTDIPKDYINITSGMGSATASTLLLVPLVLNDDVIGIIELASFHKLEDYKINFVEKLAESIASTISTVKINERTNNLLNQSKVQAEELASKEEEMRQNMEELQATQEEAARRENESNAIIKVINDKMIVVEYDMEGTVTNVNDNYAKMLGTTKENIIGQKSDDGVDLSPEKRAAHIQMWNMLRRGQVVTETSHITLNNKDLWIQETYTPVFDQNETAPYKVVKVGIDITDHVKAQEALNDLEKEKAEYAQKIAELESQQPEPTAAAPKKSSKTVKKDAEDDNEFNAAVGEQELIAWDSANETGIIEIDEQLKQLAELANTVYTTFRANKPKKEMKDTLRSLSDFAAYHFGTIEGYADESGFSDAKQMKQSFKDFSAKINDFAKLYADGKVKSADALMLFMNNWMKADFAQMKLLAESLKK